ncbi:MAG: ABC transporter substrate-binding protein [Candidatus Kariarchaeaceae archaeon]
MTTLLFGIILTAAWFLVIQPDLDTEPDIQFEISLLSPTCISRCNTVAMIAEELPKIGIGIATHSMTGWDVIGPRTFSNERDNSNAHVDGEGNIVGAIPTYDEGGFDLVLLGLSGVIDYNPTIFYSNVQFSPSSGNFASYDNDEISALITQYTSEFDPAKRALIAPDIQQFMHDDQPYINIFNTAGLWAYDASWTSLTATDLMFFGTTNYADGWKDLDHPTKNDIVYAHSYELTEFIPFAIQSYIAAQYLNPIFPGLYERDVTDPNIAYKPVIAKTLPIWNTERTVASIEINPNAKFSNGNPVTVEDVANSFRMHMTRAWSTNYATLTTYIASNDSIAVVDGKLEITLIEPYFRANELFSVPILDMSEVGTPEAPLGDGVNGYDFNTNAEKFHGAGPFVYAVDGIDAASGNVRIVADSDYWNGVPKLNSIEFRNYRSKEAALSDLQGGTVQIIDAEFYLEPGEVEGLAGVDYKINGSSHFRYGC